MGIALTETAAREAKRIIERQMEKESAGADSSGSATEKYYLRLGVKGGGCAGFDYTMDLAAQKAEDDEVFNSHGIEVVCDAKSYLYLNGVTIDFREEMMGGGFVFNNPNANTTCGCGSSFSL